MPWVPIRACSELGGFTFPGSPPEQLTGRRRPHSAPLRISFSGEKAPTTCRPKKHPYIIHLNIATCKWWFPLILGRKTPCFKLAKCIFDKPPALSECWVRISQAHSAKLCATAWASRQFSPARRSKPVASIGTSRADVFWGGGTLGTAGCLPSLPLCPNTKKLPASHYKPEGQYTPLFWRGWVGRT